VELYLLHLRIELLKKRLVRLAEDRGRTHPMVLAMSRRIDRLIVEHMNTCLRRRKQNRRVRRHD
jgi:hypothetical protein